MVGESISVAPIVAIFRTPFPNVIARFFLRIRFHKVQGQKGPGHHFMMNFIMKLLVTKNEGYGTG